MAAHSNPERRQSVTRIAKMGRGAKRPPLATYPVQAIFGRARINI